MGEGLPVRVVRSQTGRRHESMSSREFFGWRTRSLAALSDIVGDDHHYVKGVTTACGSAAQLNDSEPGVHILKSLKADIEAGYLREMENLISTEVFGDLLDMAQHLLDQNYKGPAASLTGAVLEDELRRIARNHLQIGRRWC